MRKQKRTEIYGDNKFMKNQNSLMTQSLCSLLFNELYTVFSVLSIFGAVAIIQIGQDQDRQELETIGYVALFAYVVLDLSSVAI